MAAQYARSRLVLTQTGSPRSLDDDGMTACSTAANSNNSNDSMAWMNLGGADWFMDSALGGKSGRVRRCAHGPPLPPAAPPSAAPRLTCNVIILFGVIFLGRARRLGRADQRAARR